MAECAVTMMERNAPDLEPHTPASARAPTGDAERVLALLSGDPVGALTIASLRDRGVRAPAQAVYELQLAGYEIERVSSRAGIQGTRAYRLATSPPSPPAPPPLPSLQSPSPQSPSPLEVPETPERSARIRRRRPSPPRPRARRPSHEPHR
jgi:hypothetical protein